MTLAVRNTAELRRILALPRRDLPPPGSAKALRLAAFWTKLLRRPGGAQEVNYGQALALEEAYRTLGRLYLSAAVGVGKTLLGWLLLTLFEAERGVIVAPSGMHREMLAMHESYRRHWLAPPAPPTLVAYEDLDRAEENPWLELNPDAVIWDEAHRARRGDRIAVKHTDRWLRMARQGLVPMPRVRCAMTATPGRKSIEDNAHQLVWCLDEGAPVPRTPSERFIWSGALDLDGARHFGVGALRGLGGEGKTLKAKAQDWYGQRLAATPGVVLLDVESCDKALTIRQICPPPCAKIEAAFKRFRTLQETPSGEEVGDPMQAWALEQELALGYHGVWDPPPPDEWLRRRKAMRKFVRSQIGSTQRSRKPLDTESRVLRAFPEAPAVSAWLEVKDTFRVNPKPVWLSPSVVQFVADWLRANGPVLCYVWSKPFCRALERATGYTWYGPKGLDARGRYVSDDPGTESVIVSGQANTEGRNLQKHWHRALAVNAPQSAQWLEQFFGRIHRQNQTRDVEIFTLISCAAQADGFETAVAEADFGKVSFRVDQKIRRAKIERTLTPKGTYRWA